MHKVMAVLLAAFLGLALSAPAHAHGYEVGELEIGHPWSRETPPGASVGAGYLTVTNNGDRADRLVDADSPAADRVEIHRSIEEDGVSRMEHQDEGVKIPAGEEIAIEPGGYHLMLMGLDEPLSEDERIPVTLEFERAGSVEVELVVEPLAGADEHSDH